MLRFRLLLCALWLVAPQPSVGETNHLTDARAGTPEGAMHAVIEIPAGTNAKWEVDTEGRLVWEQQDGRPRMVDYLPYPANYGMVPRTLQSAAGGGDGDPLDVLVLGPALPRGTLVATRPIGVIRLRDGGERDDKLLAVSPEGPLRDVQGLPELESRYPGALRILRIWLENYKGPGRIQVVAILGADAAWQDLAEASAAFEGGADE